MLLVKLFELAGPERPSLGAAGLCKVAETVCAAVPLGVVYVIGRALLSGEPAPSAWGTALVLGGAFAAQGVFFYLATRLSSSAGFRLTCRLRLRLVEHLRRLPLGEVKRRDSGDLTAILMQDVTSIEQVPSLIFTRHVAGLTMPVVLLAGCAVVDWRLAALLVVGIPPAVLLYLSAGRRLKREAAAGVAWRGRMAALILEFLQGMRIIKGFHAERPLARLDEAIARYRDGCKGVTGVAVRATAGFPALLDAGVLAAGAWVVHGLITGAVTPADFILVWFVCLRVFTPVHEFIEFSAMLELMEASMARIAAVLKEEPLPEPADPRRPASFGVEFDQVRFRYGNEEVLHDVSFAVPEGGVTAIVGPSGAGKSTLLRLLMRSWDVTGGAVRIGGVDLRAMDEATRCACVSVVSQDVFLIAGSVKENILVGRPDASDAEVAAAAKAAQCHAFVSALPKGYDTVLGDRGHTLSGGERQRIALARAILKDAPIVLLDEATSALDPQNELLVQRALGTLLRGRTVLVVAHRLRSVVNADRIVVIERGRVVQQGIHAVLAGQEGVYARLWATYREGDGWIASPGPRPEPAV